MPFKVLPNPDFKTTFNGQLSVIAGVAATSFAVELDTRLAAGDRGGIKYEKLPRVSSAPGEPEQEQYGELRGSVGAIPLNIDFVGVVHAWYFGFVRYPMADPVKLEALEINQADPSYRGTLHKVAGDTETYSQALRDIQDALL